MIVQSNLDCLLRILQFNVAHTILFFRITSGLVPFASHPVCQFDWAGCFSQDFQTIGRFIKQNSMRISMHPGQFTLLNSENPAVVENSIKELSYHAKVLDLMELDATAKLQVHLGGVYGNRQKSIERFITNYRALDENIRRRLVIENDDHSYTLKDCLEVHRSTGIPVLFDTLHHRILCSGESIGEAISLVTGTWHEDDGTTMVDYSSSDTNDKRHSKSLDKEHFSWFLNETRPFDFDVILEIKDKEASAMKALQVAQDDERFYSL